MVRLVFAADALLILLHYVSQWLEYHGERVFDRRFEGHGLFDLDHEISIPAWWAQSKWVGAALLALVLSIVMAGHARDRRWWSFVAVVFLVISIDEGAEMHERLIEPMPEAFGITQGVFWLAWLLPGLVVLAVLVVALFPFVRRQSRAVRRPFAVGVALFAAGAAAMEMVAGAVFGDHGAGSSYAVVTGLEESLEMAGASIVVVGLLRALAQAEGRFAVIVTGAHRVEHA